MKRGLTIGLTIAALGIAAPFASAGSSSPELATEADAVPAYEIDSSSSEPVTEADAVPADEVLTTLRDMGLDPNADAVRRGPYYVLHAIDPLGVEMRVVADAEFGDILSVAPAAHPYNFVPPYFNGPRIIQVPQAGDGDLGAVEPSAPPRAQPRRAKPRRKYHSEAPPPPPKLEQRAVLSAPPPRPEGPSPIYPTPTFGKTDENAGVGEKFGAQHR